MIGKIYIRFDMNRKTIITITLLVLVIISGYGFSYFIQWTPSPDFLSDIATITGVVIALVIPLSFDMISRISERYETDIIIKKFRKEVIVKLLERLLVLCVIIAILLKVFYEKNILYIHDASVWNRISWILIFFFIYTIFIFLEYIEVVRKYTFNIEKVINELFDDANEALK